MAHYQISPSLVKRIIRFPKRIEEGIADNTVAVMKPAGTSRYSEVWVMYQTVPATSKNKPRLKIIAAWRYPAESSARDPIPEDILQEIKSVFSL